MLNIPKSSTITKQVTSFLLGDDKAKYLKGVAEDITADISNSVLQANVDEFELNCEASGINITYVYCNKTGRRIATRERSEIELLFLLNKTLDKIPKQMPEYIEFTGGCSPAWINTDSEHLQALMKHDPHGYVLYILGYAARNSFKRMKQYGNKMNATAAPDMEVSRKINQSLIRGFIFIKNQPLERVVEAAEMLQRFFTIYNPREIKWPMLMPHHYCTADGLTELFDEMEKQISSVVLERNLFSRIITNIKIVDAIKKAGGTGGASNIVGQGKKRGNLAMDQIADLFTSMRLDFDKIHGDDIIHDETARQKLIMQTRKIERAKLFNKKKALGGNLIQTIKSTAKFSFIAKAN